MNNIDKAKRTIKKRDLKIKAAAFFEVSEKLRHEYDGDYSSDSIGEFFNGLAKDLMLEAGNLDNKID